MKKQAECNQYWHLLNDYVDGRLAGRRVQKLEKHLRSCSECRNTLAGIRRWEDLASGEEIPAPSADFWNRCSARVAQKEVPFRPAKSKFRIAFGITLSSAVAAGLVIFSLTARTPQEPVNLTNDYVMEHAAFAASLPLSIKAHHVLLSAKGAEKRENSASKDDSESSDNDSY